jgi:lipoprotein-anchoring transpeptidase ErfK/SrfK
MNADLAIERAYQALQAKDNTAARRWAEQAAALDPQREEPWLILSALASPKASVAYLQQALQINPESRRAKEGLAWAQRRLQAQTAECQSSSSARAQPERGGLSPADLVIWIAIVVVMLGLGIWLVWLPTQIPGAAAPISLPPTLALKLPEPTATYSAAPTYTPLPAQTIPPTGGVVLRSSATLAPTVLPTASPSPLSTVSLTPLPTATLLPIPTLATPTTYVVQSGDTLTGIAQAFGIEPLDLMIANQIPNADQIQVGKTLIIPAGGLDRRRATVTAVAAATVGTVTAPKSVIVKLSEQRMYAYLGDRNVYTFVVSTGRDSVTWTGNFRILDKEPNAYSEPWGFWMPYWIGIYYVGNGTLENGFHSLPVLPDGTQLWGDSLGTPVSYGCVVLGPTDAKFFYEWAEIGMPVIIQN